MDRSVIDTGDGSKTLYVAALDETYHSHHGAIQESGHVFLKMGLEQLVSLRGASDEPISIFEMGFGTGLNALLSLLFAREKSVRIRYHSLEKYPIGEAEALQLGYGHSLAAEQDFLKLHRSPWGSWQELDPAFHLFKEKGDLKSDSPKLGPYDLIYWDAFAPTKQPELWQREAVAPVVAALKTGGVLVTYSSQGRFKRLLQSLGLEVAKVPGPPGKREMLQAIKA